MTLVKNIRITTQVRQHLFAFLAVIAIGSVVSGNVLLNANVLNTPSIVAEIGIEHNEQGELTFEWNIIDRVALLNITNTEVEDVHISVPSDWVRSEVRNVPLRSIVADSPSFGFTRYSLPATARVTFRVSTVPTELIVHNPSQKLLKLNTVIVDLNSEQVSHDVILITTPVVQIW